ncbi:hypothetical protein ACEU6E_07125 [Halorutilales archaeon Cl-col2-1]
MENISRAQEKQLLDDLIHGLEGALSELDTGSRPFKQATHGEIKLHKTIFLGVDWSRIPVQYSWHTYGPDLGNSVPSPEGIQPTALNEIPHPFTPSVRPRVTDRYPSPQEYQEFYLGLELGEFEGLEEILESDLHDFLRDFYMENAPSQFKQLYLHNVKFQRFLWDDAESLNVVFVDEDYCRELGRIISDLHGELLKLEVFNEVAEQFITYTDLVEDIYMKLGQSNQDELDCDPRTIIRELSDFYHDYAWKYVAETISRETPHGINKNEIREGASDELQFLDKNYDDFLYNLEGLCADAGLIPEPDDYYPESSETSVKETVSELTETYDKINSG